MIRADIYQDENTLWVIADVAGASCDRIAVFAERCSLRIAVGYQRLNLHPGLRCHRRERPARLPDELRTVELPVPVWAARSEGSLEDGLLVLRLRRAVVPPGAEVPGLVGGVRLVGTSAC